MWFDEIFDQKLVMNNFYNQVSKWSEEKSNPFWFEGFDQKLAMKYDNEWLWHLMLNFWHGCRIEKIKNKKIKKNKKK